MERKQCLISSVEFEVTDSDLEYYASLDVPSPRLSPTERSRRRMSFGNHRNLYLRICAATGKRIVTNFPPDWSGPVYDVGYWHSNSWNPLSTGRDYNFSRAFFPQFQELMTVAPLPGLLRAPQYDENCEYTNYAGKNKDCYMIFDSDKNRECYYSFSINSCTDVIDCFRADSCELCYECIDCSKCYNSKYLQNCDTCSDSWFLKNCIGCAFCFGSVNLRNKRYYFFNEQLTESEYCNRLNALSLGKRSTLTRFRSDFRRYAEQFPHKFMHGVHNEEVTGDYLYHCKDAEFCFDSRKLWGCKYVTQSFDAAKSCMDCTEVGDSAELLYESCYGGYEAYSNRFCSHFLGSTSFLTYCLHCVRSSNLFGCVGLHDAHYCIFNKQYSKDDFKTLNQRIISQMKISLEWGEFFPAALSPFPYNKSHAQDYLPLTKAEALDRGYKWEDDENENQSKDKEICSAIPETISEVGRDILFHVFNCARSGKRFKYQRAELALYRKMNLPLPEICPDERHLYRLQCRNRRELFSRNCDISGKPLLSSFAPGGPEKVVSEEEFWKLLD